MDLETKIRDDEKTLKRMEERFKINKESFENIEGELDKLLELQAGIFELRREIESEQKKSKIHKEYKYNERRLYIH